MQSKTCYALSGNIGINFFALFDWAQPCSCIAAVGEGADSIWGSTYFWKLYM